MPALAQKNKNPRPERETSGKKNKRRRKRNAPPQPEGRIQRAEQPEGRDPSPRPARPVRGSGRVPTAEAFNQVKRLPPPNLPRDEWRREQQQAQKRGEEAASFRPPPRTLPQPEPQPPAPSGHRKKLSPARRRRNRRLLALAAILLLIVGGIYFSVTVFFKIDKFTVEGESIYTDEEIIAAFGHERGDHMFSFSADTAARTIEEALPYIERVQLLRRLPNTVLLRVTPAQEKYYLEYGGQYAVVSAQSKVLRLAAEAPDGLTLLIGLEGLTLLPGRPLAQPAGSEAEPQQQESSSVSGSGSGAPPVQNTAEDRYEAMLLLLQQLDEVQLADVNWVDVSDPLNLRFGWQNRITVKLGTQVGLSEKMAAVVLILTDPEQSEITEGDKGTLDAGSYTTTLRVWFTAE